MSQKIFTNNEINILDISRVYCLFLSRSWIVDIKYSHVRRKNIETTCAQMQHNHQYIQTTCAQIQQNHQLKETNKITSTKDENMNN